MGHLWHLGYLGAPQARHHASSRRTFLTPQVRTVMSGRDYRVRGEIHEDHRAQAIGRAFATALLTLLASFLIILSGSAPAQASHYRANQLTWHAGATPGAVEFHLSGSWRCTFYSDPCTLVPGDTLTSGFVDTGDGGSLFPDLIVVSVDVANDVVTAEAHADYTYAAPGSYVAFAEDCCRLSDSGGHMNNPDGNVRFETLVNLGGDEREPGRTRATHRRLPPQRGVHLRSPGHRSRRPTPYVAALHGR